MARSVHWVGHMILRTSGTAMRIRALRVTFRDALLTASTQGEPRQRTTIAHAVQRGEEILREIRSAADPGFDDELDTLADEIRAAARTLAEA